MTARTRNYIQDKGYDAAAAITKFRAVKFSAEETVTPVTAAADFVAGVAQNDVTAGEILEGKGCVIAVEGDTEWECSEAIAVGQPVSIGTDGRCQVGVTAAERVHGDCVEPTTLAGQRARIHLSLNGNVV
jgi:hypothetical protein